MPAKYRQLAAVLRAGLLSGAYQGQTFLPTEQELAQRYRVSRQTVRQALALLSQEGLIQRRQGSGSRILFQNITPESRRVAVLLPRETSYALPDLAQDIHAQLARYGFLPQVLVTGESWAQEGALLDRLLEQPVAGVLAAAVKTGLPSPNLHRYQELLRRQCPLVFLHRPCPGLPEAVWISEDDLGGSYTLTRALLSRGQETLGGLFAADDRAGQDRFQGMVQALRDRGADCTDGQFFWFTRREREAMIEEGDTDALLRFLRRCGCSALICQDDEIALCVSNLLRRLEPEQTPVLASFDGSPLAARCPRMALTMARPTHRLGTQAAELLVRQMTGEAAASQLVEWTLSVRGPLSV